MPDVREQRINTNPLVYDCDKVYDSDGDTLMNLQETHGLAVQTMDLNTTDSAASRTAEARPAHPYQY